MCIAALLSRFGIKGFACNDQVLMLDVLSLKVLFGYKAVVCFWLHILAASVIAHSSKLTEMVKLHLVGCLDCVHCLFCNHEQHSVCFDVSICL